ncbi:hypothetical protein BSKO_04132 [Bryopsis sp. KO-2023]|nr:hypothetical protein BSKO_04132 [Bryopsis sp. KO-2023]
MKGMRPRPSQPSQGGRTDLLLRLFDSDFFDAWLALTYIYQRDTSGVHDYLCNKLYELPERDIERYLSQFCQVIVAKPGSSLERVVIDLCARSLRIAVKVFWLFRAICQDQPKNRHAHDMRDKCERAALNGYWELPFKNCALDPLSPRDEPPSTPIRTTGSPHSQTVSVDGSEGTPQSRNPASGDAMRSGDFMRYSMGGRSASLCSSHDVGQGLEGLIGAPVTPKAIDLHLDLGSGLDTAASVDMSVETDSSAHFERCRVLHAELGDGEGVTALLEKSTRNAAQGGSGCVAASEDEPPPPPSSPRLRQTTFGATLDLIDALCNASSGLVHFPQEMRKKALCRALMDINAEIDLCSSKNVAVWFPMGAKNQRVLRLVANDAVILNSREKAPFMLYVEVLETDKGNDDGEASEQEQYADSAHSLMNSRSESHVEAGPGPGSQRQPRGSSSPPNDSTQPGIASSHSRHNSIEPPSPPPNGRTLSESSAWKSELESRGSASSGMAGVGESGSPAGPSTPGSSKPPLRPGNHEASTLSAEAIKELKSVGVAGSLEARKNSFTRRIDTAMASLRGDAPMVKLNLTVLEDSAEEVSMAGRENSEDILPPGASAAAAALAEKDGEGISTSKALSLLSRLGLCRTTCLDLGLNEEWYHRQKKEKKIVSVSLEVIGGVNLRIPSPSKRGRRVPSQEAIESLADKMKLPQVPPPFPSGPQFLPLDMQSRAWSERSEASSRISVTPSTQDLGRNELKALKKQKQANEVYGRRFHQKVESIRKQSPHGRRKGWACRCVMVKSGDDCRQELMAVQLIKTFQGIFREAKLPLWVRPYEVLVTSNRTALIEFVPDSLSIHTVKSRSPPGTSLSQHFFNKFRKGTPECATAQRHFVESMAAYSIISYLLQLKDRHNGNLLLDDEGHLIHIDFGFMLGSSPGGVNFEAAPFKLTREYLEVMDSDSEGKPSEMFDYFKVLCIQGFMACRKHSDRIINLCDMMSKAGFPCFKSGDRTIKALKKRFHLNCPEEQSIQVVIGLISDSLDAWRTRQYDYYQRVLNGIL